jgi:hypothetical protein
VKTTAPGRGDDDGMATVRLGPPAEADVTYLAADLDMTPERVVTLAVEWYRRGYEDFKRRYPDFANPPGRKSAPTP